MIISKHEKACYRSLNHDNIFYREITKEATIAQYDIMALLNNEEEITIRLLFIIRNNFIFQRAL